MFNRTPQTMRTAVTNPDVAARMLAPNIFDGIGSTPEECAAIIRREREASLELVHLAGLVPAR
jgi:tripartite-type tricarboxylate transporter receptor subunit TctC